MSWNHRVIKQVSPSGETYLGIHEVYYYDDGRPRAYTKNAVSISGETIAGLHWVLRRMTEALTKPVLTPEDFDDHLPDHSGDLE